MSQPSPLLRLPRELRDQIFEYVSLYYGVGLSASSNGRLISSCPLLLASRAISEEFNDSMHSTAAVITAEVYKLDFSHVIDGVKDILARRTAHPSDATLARPKHSPEPRQLDLVLILTRDFDRRRHLTNLTDWLDLWYSEPFATSFTTTYAIDTSKTTATEPVSPITLMQTLDELMHDWYLPAPSGPRRDEIHKVCECLGQAEMQINRMRTNAIHAGPRMGGLEVF